MKPYQYIVLSIMLLVGVGCERRGNELDAYAQAIVDASRELTTTDIYNKLVPIRYDDSPLLEWKIADEDSMILVSTLQSEDWYYADVQCGEQLTTSEEPDYMLWVTIPNELNQYLANEAQLDDSTTVQQRMIQILGMKSSDTNSVVNLLWVNKNDIIRPSYNPDPTATHGAVEFPETLPFDWYSDWFTGNVAYSYESPVDGLNYPFTRLGYTYDWGEGKSKYGLSEFLIKPSSTITLENKMGCWEYYKQIMNN